MTRFETHIDNTISNFFREHIHLLSNFEQINSVIKKICGINSFFSSQKESTLFKEKLLESTFIVSEPDRREYGDFQTNTKLTREVVEYISNKNSYFEFILEPTCGQGNFILASLKQFPNVKKIVGIEIYLPYVQETKLKILSFYMKNLSKTVPDIDIIHANAFNFDFVKLSDDTKKLKTLIIGNPPWVTNAELGVLNSDNLPQKNNFKNLNGLDAITGKGNFDIGEYIALLMVRNFSKHNGNFGFLVKNTVIKNLIQEQKRNRFKISLCEKLNIDSKKEFNVSVNASLFYCSLNHNPEFECVEKDYYTQKQITKFGWVKDSFVYSINDYLKYGFIEGKSPFTWRSGLKHDCAKVMEIEKSDDGIYSNALGQKFSLENDLLFGLLKSSDLKDLETNKSRKLTIITQKKIGQSTNYIKKQYPLTYKYLFTNQSYFDKRKSSIYNDKPKFSIFGIGTYSFKKYKIAISGLYKTTHFTLVMPQDGKTIMVDDTCYSIGFNDLKTARIVHFLLNSNIVQTFLGSIIFSDAKRPINKDVLMRLDLRKVLDSYSFNELKNELNDITEKDWENIKYLINKKTEHQMTLFE